MKTEATISSTQTTNQPGKGSPVVQETSSHSSIVQKKNKISPFTRGYIHAFGDNLFHPPSLYPITRTISRRYGIHYWAATAVRTGVIWGLFHGATGGILNPDIIKRTAFSYSFGFLGYPDAKMKINLVYSNVIKPGIQNVRETTKEKVELFKALWKLPADSTYQARKEAEEKLRPQIHERLAYERFIKNHTQLVEYDMFKFHHDSPEAHPIQHYQKTLRDLLGYELAKLKQAHPDLVTFPTEEDMKLPFTFLENTENTINDHYKQELGSAVWKFVKAAAPLFVTSEILALLISRCASLFFADTFHPNTQVTAIATSLIVSAAMRGRNRLMVAHNLTKVQLAVKQLQLQQAEHKAPDEISHSNSASQPSKSDAVSPAPITA